RTPQTWGASACTGSPPTARSAYSVCRHEHVEKSIDCVLVEGAGREQPAVVESSTQDLGGVFQIRVGDQLTVALSPDDPLQGSLFDRGQESFVQRRSERGVGLSFGNDRPVDGADGRGGESLTGTHEL